MIGMNHIIDIFRNASDIDFSIYKTEASELELKQDDYRFLKSKFEYGPSKPKPTVDPNKMPSWDQMDYFAYEAGLNTPLNERIMAKETRFLIPNALLHYYFFYLARNGMGFIDEKKILQTIGRPLIELGINRNDKLFYDISRAYWTLKALLHIIFSGNEHDNTSRCSDDIKFSNAVQLLVSMDLSMGSYFFPTDATKMPGADTFIPKSRMDELNEIKISDSVRLNNTIEFLRSFGMYSEEEIKLIIKQNPRYFSSDPGCFIATAIYDSHHSPEVIALRNWRDIFLLNNRYGKLFVKYYYKYSPVFAKNLRHRLMIKSVIKFGLDRFVQRL